MFMRRALGVLLIAGVALLIAAASMLAAGRLLTALGDPAAHIVDRIALVTAAVLAGDIVCLVLLQGYVLLSVWEEELHEPHDEVAEE